jgi:phage-related protein
VTSKPSQRWQIVYYQDHRGQRPVREFLDGLNATDRAPVLRSFALLEEFGLAVGWPHVRPITGHRKLWELRVRGQVGAIRLFYLAHTDRRFIILHGFVKKGGKTPSQEIDVAIRRMQDILEREE